MKQFKNTIFKDKTLITSLFEVSGSSCCWTGWAELKWFEFESSKDMSESGWLKSVGGTACSIGKLSWLIA